MLDKIFDTFHSIAASPKAQLDKYLAEGKKVVLTVPYYIPEEIICAMGYVPMGAWGADLELNRAKEYCPAFLCSIVQSGLELGIKGAYDGASAMVIPYLCDTLKTMGENWKYAVPSIPFFPMIYPQRRKEEFGIAFTRANFQRLIHDLETLGGSFDEEELKKAIAVYNRHNQVMREADLLLAEHPEVSAQQRSDLFKSAFFMKKEEHTQLVEEMIAELKKTEPGREGLRILVSGILTDAPALNEIFADLGMHIVADDVAAQSRQYHEDVHDYEADPLLAMAKRFAAMDLCSTLYNVNKPRVKWIVDTVRERKAEGVVLALTKFCDPEEFDLVIIRKACEEADIPFSLIEVDRQMVHFEQIRTNLETFRDMLTIY